MQLTADLRVSLSSWQRVVGVFLGFLLVCLLGIFRIVLVLVVVGLGLCLEHGDMGCHRGVVGRGRGLRRCGVCLLGVFAGSRLWRGVVSSGDEGGGEGHGLSKGGGCLIVGLRAVVLLPDCQSTGTSPQ